VVRAAGAEARLAGSSPNRFRYEIRAERPARIALPLRFGSRGAEWETGAFRPLAQDGRLALEVPAGAHEVELAYRPPWLRAGIALSAAALALLLALGARAIFR
jgi:hypothetical protein